MKILLTGGTGFIGTHLTKALSRPAVLPMPVFMVKLLFGEMGERLLLHGQNVLPKKLLSQGFEFDFENIESALSESLNG